MLAIYAVDPRSHRWSSGSDVALRYWVVPVLLGQPLLRLYLLAEHWGCPIARQAPIDMLARSRTTYTNVLVTFPGLEHALSCRASRQSGNAVPCPAAAPMRC